jgi:predicted RNA-binding Zn-ribbon protein involved in translation (DUF1610 family)
MTEMPLQSIRAFLAHQDQDPSGCPFNVASAKGNHVAVPDTPPEAEASSACPNCGTEMVIIRIKPILFSWKFEDLTLACKKCGSTKELRLKSIRDRKPA